MRSSRRGVLRLAAAGVAALVARPALARPRHGAAALAWRLASLPRSGPSMRRLGRLYLKDRPQAPAELAVAVAGSAAEAARLAGLADEDLAEWLRWRTAADFAAGRTVRLSGWVLAEAEAKACALAALV